MRQHTVRLSSDNLIPRFKGLAIKDVELTHLAGQVDGQSMVRLYEQASLVTITHQGETKVLKARDGALDA